MSKKKRSAVQKQNVKSNNRAENPTDSMAENSSTKGWWKSLSRQGRWAAVGVIVFLAVGVFGAGLKYLEDSANKQKAQKSLSAANQEHESWLNSINPFITTPSPTPTPQLSKEYLYAGSRLLAVEDANANVAPPADLAIWRPSTGYWWVMGGQGSQQTSQQWGMANDIPVPGDYDGDGKTDFSIFRPDTTAHTGTWYVLYSSSGSWTSYQFGLDDDKVAQADYDGDGRTDVALWRPSNGAWYILRSSDGGISYATLGTTGNFASPADYDGDGKADVAVWNNSTKTFQSINSSNQQTQTATFSQSSTEPVSGDYDGDGKADYAIRNSTDWIIRYSSTGTIQTPVSWQQSGDKAVPNDYDGDGKVDIAVWRESNGNWYIRKSSNGQLRQEQWGMTGDIPVPAFYRR